jgi:hypothetical protein
MELAAPQLPATPSRRPDEHHQELNQVKLLTFETNKEPHKEHHYSSTAPSKHQKTNSTHHGVHLKLKT